jgi:hypothetical protein
MGGDSKRKAVAKRSEGVFKEKKNLGAAMEPRKKPAAREPAGQPATRDSLAKGRLQQQEDSENEPEESAGSSSSDESDSESGGEVGGCWHACGLQRRDMRPDLSRPHDPPQAGEIPFGELQQLRQDGSTTAEAMKARAAALRKSGGAQQFKRAGKHRPMEAPSKKPVPVFREVFQEGKR